MKRISMLLLMLWAGEFAALAVSPITIAWSNAPRTFDPRYAVDADSQYLEGLLHCSLIQYDPQGRIIPGLAKSWNWSKDARILTMDLRQDARFHDGSLVKADDVAATFQFFLRKKVAVPTPRGSAFRGVEKVVAEKNSVKFFLKEVDATLISNLGIGILAKDQVIDGVLTEESNIKGCGPYKLKKSSLQSLVLEKNSHYSFGNIPSNDLVIKVVADESTRFAKLASGELDLVQNNLSVEKIKTLSKYKDLSLIKRPGLKTSYVGFNTRDRYLKNPKVREAIDLAVDRQAMIHYLLHGMAKVSTTLLPEGHEFYSSEIQTPKFDLKKANALLDQEGYKKNGRGIRFTLTYKTSQNETRIAIGKAIAINLRKIGIELKVRSLEWGKFKADVDKGHVQLWGLSWIGFKDPDIYRYAFASESFPPHGGNRGFYSNAVLDQLLGKAKITTDLKQRKELYHKVQSIVAKDRPYVFLWHEEIYAVARKSIKNYEVYADGRYSGLTKVVKSL